MSENKINDKDPKKPVIDAEVVESIIDETVQDSTEEEIAEDVVEYDTSSENEQTTSQLEPAVIKKGGGLSFLTLLFSLAALVGTGYMYYMQNMTATKTKEVVETKPVDNKYWQAPLTKLEFKLNQKIMKINQQIESIPQEQSALDNSLVNYDDSEIKQLFADLNNKIESQEAIIQNIKSLISQNTSPGDIAKPIIVEKYDDAELISQIKALNDKLIAQQSSVDVLKNLQEETKIAQIQSFQQLIKQVESQNNVSRNNSQFKTMDLTYTLAESHLHSAYRFLNVINNKTSANDSLAKAIEQLNKTENPEYMNLGEELLIVSQHIKNTKTPDFLTIQKQIEALSSTSSEFTFSQDSHETSSKENKSAWYDKLVTIRKIDDSKSNLLTSNEQYTIKQTIKTHFDLLKLALLNKNQLLWIKENSHIQKLISENFPNQAIDTINKLELLAGIEINPQFPDLSNYVQKLSALNSNISEGE